MSGLPLRRGCFCHCERREAISAPLRSDLVTPLLANDEQASHPGEAGSIRQLGSAEKRIQLSPG
jgi:hypothetical protein